MNLIDTRGNGHIGVIRAFISKEPSTYGYNLMIELNGRADPVNIGYATPGEDILPEVRDVIVNNMVRNVEVLDLRDHFEPETQYFGWYGCTILKKGSERT